MAKGSKWVDTRKSVYVRIRSQKRQRDEEVVNLIFDGVTPDQVAAYVKRKVNSVGLSHFLTGYVTSVEIRHWSNVGGGIYLSFRGLSAKETDALLTSHLPKF